MRIGLAEVSTPALFGALLPARLLALLAPVRRSIHHGAVNRLVNGSRASLPANHVSPSLARIVRFARIAIHAAPSVPAQRRGGGRSPRCPFAGTGPAPVSNVTPIRSFGV